MLFAASVSTPWTMSEVLPGALNVKIPWVPKTSSRPLGSSRTTAASIVPLMFDVPARTMFPLVSTATALAESSDSGWIGIFWSAPLLNAGSIAPVVGFSRPATK